VVGVCTWVGGILCRMFDVSEWMELVISFWQCRCVIINYKLRIGYLVL
jgi:hypothetical protein